VIIMIIIIPLGGVAVAEGLQQPAAGKVQFVQAPPVTLNGHRRMHGPTNAQPPELA
jgi:hypothetical protein